MAGVEDDQTTPATQEKGSIEEKPCASKQPKEQCQKHMHTASRCDRCSCSGNNCGHLAVIYIWLSALTVACLSNWLYYGIVVGIQSKHVLERRVQRLEKAAEYRSPEVTTDATTAHWTETKYTSGEEDRIEALTVNLTILREDVEKLRNQLENITAYLWWLETGQNLMEHNVSLLKHDVSAHFDRLDTLELTSENLQTTQQTVLQHLMHNVGELGVSDQITYDMISHLDAKVHNITGVQEVVGKHVFSLEETVMHQKRSMLSIEESTDILKRKQEAMNGRVVLLESDVKEHDQRLNTVEMKSDTLNQTQQVYWKRLRLVEVNSASRTKVDERMVLLIILIMATMAIHSMYNMCYYDGTNKY